MATVVFICDRVSASYYYTLLTHKYNIFIHIKLISHGLVTPDPTNIRDNYSPQYVDITCSQ